MSILSTISRGKRPRHIFALFYSTDGVGKTTVCSHAPNPIFIGAEKGTEQLDVARFPQTESISELLAQIRALQSEKHDFDSVVLDSLDWVEPLIWKAVCDEGKVETIEQYAGGYGKGYVRALDLWRTLLGELSVLNEKMHVLLIGHAQIKSFQDPELPTAYDRYQLKINDKAAALVREAADAVLFARFETELVKTSGKARARGEGVRVMYSESRPAFDAKNRFNLPFCMPLEGYLLCLVMIRVQTRGGISTDHQDQFMLWIISWRHDGAGNGWVRFIGPHKFLFHGTLLQSARLELATKVHTLRKL
jgi:hypothetical protein